MVVRISTVLLLTAQLAAGTDDVLPAPDGWSGTLILVGGGAVPDEVLITLKDSLGADGSLVVIAEAASDPGPTSEATQKWLLEHEITNVMSVDPSLPANERWQITERAIDAASAVWICGGQQLKLAEAYSGSGIESALQRLLMRGGTIAGSSAGSAIMSKVMIGSGTEQPKISTGWDLLPDAIIDQHFTKRKRLTRSQIAVGIHPECFGIGIDEATAVFVKGRRIRITGRGNVSILLAKTHYRDAESIILEAGNAADLTQLRRAARQRSSRIDPGEPLDVGVPEVRSGSLVIVGGGGMPEDVVKRFIELAGGETANIIVLPTAMPREETSSRVPGFLKQEKVNSVTVLTQRGPDEVISEEFRAALRSATGIWFGGGRQWNFVDAYEGTKAVELFRDVLRRGGVIAGSSAGATIQGEFLLRGHPLGNMVMMAEGYEQGFAFFPGTAIDQHFSQRNRQPDLLPVIRRHPKMLGIGIDEATAIVVKGTTIEVIGQHSAHFVSAKQLKALPADQPLPTAVDEVVKYYESVKTGETIDLKAIMK